jgi:hypothetical protein
LKKLNHCFAQVLLEEDNFLYRRKEPSDWAVVAAQWQRSKAVLPKG